MTDPQVLRQSIQVGHVMNMIAELPRYVDDRALPLGLRAAAVDAFFVSLRALTEFLTKEDSRTIQWRDYTQNFHLDAPLRQRLLDGYELASQQVAHLNKTRRVPTATSPPEFTISTASIRAYADDAFAGMDRFLDHLKNRMSPYATEFDRLLTEARSRRK